jgi:TRAP-type C4-dicarboxylate transport system permease small subunit
MVHALAAAFALAGAAVMIAITAMTVVSIVGRMGIPLGLKPVPGDVEITQGAMAFAIFAFLPWCHLNRGHAIVSILTDRLPVRISAILEFLMDLTMFVAAAFIAWRLGAGLGDKIGNREQTFILRLPLWWSYAAGLAGAIVYAIIALYCAVQSGRNAASADPAPPYSETAE